MHMIEISLRHLGPEALVGFDVLRRILVDSIVTNVRIISQSRRPEDV